MECILASQFAIIESSTTTCTTATVLKAGQSCTLTLKYTANQTSGQITPVFTYDDNNAGTPAKNTGMTVTYTAATPPGPTPPPPTPFSVLTVSPNDVHLTPQHPRVVLTITNTPGGSTAGTTIPSGWTLPTLSAPLEFESTSCYNPPVGNSGPAPQTMALAVNASCTYTFKYSMASSSGTESPVFTYNNGMSSNQQTSVAVDWISIPVVVASLESNTTYSETSITYAIQNESFFVVLHGSNINTNTKLTYQVNLPDSLTFKGGANNCTISVGNPSCSIAVFAESVPGDFTLNLVPLNGATAPMPESLNIQVAPYTNSIK